MKFGDPILAKQIVGSLFEEEKEREIDQNNCESSHIDHLEMGDPSVYDRTQNRSESERERQDNVGVLAELAGRDLGIINIGQGDQHIHGKPEQYVQDCVQVEIGNEA